MAMKFKVANFEEIPASMRSGGGRKSELLNAVRELNEKQKLEFHIPDDEDFNARVAQIRSSLNREGALDFRPTTRTNPEKREISIFREAGSNYIRNDKGEYITNKEGKRLTKAKADKANVD